MVGWGGTGKERTERNLCKNLDGDFTKDFSGDITGDFRMALCSYRQRQVGYMMGMAVSLIVFPNAYLRLAKHLSTL